MRVRTARYLENNGAGSRSAEANRAGRLGRSALHRHSPSTVVRASAPSKTMVASVRRRSRSCDS